MEKELRQELTCFFVQKEMELCIQKEPNRLSFLTKKVMYDPGLSADNKVIDLFYDEEKKVLFVGLLRLPHAFRGKKISTELVHKIQTIAQKQNYIIFLSACDECNVFWRKQEFLSLFKNKEGFDVMGYPKEKELLLTKWREVKQSSLIQDVIEECE
jgi:hypothetical protein